MEKIITMENLNRFAYCNINACKKPIRGIIVSFFGLGESSMYDEDTYDGKRFGGKGFLYVIPYYNPWAWMNKQTVNYTDEIIEVLFEGLNLPEDMPVISAGGSMGGLSSLVYTAYSKRTPVACVANCPVTDLPYHYTERPDLPRTLYSAFGMYDCDLEQALKSASPVYLVEKMPISTAYCIFHCEEDKLVNKQMHSDVFVEKMKKNHNIEYYAVANKEHCDLTEEMWQLYTDFILSFAKQ